MPSHGGSRLNASKPEACPKTRCPTKHFFSVRTVCSTTEVSTTPIESPLKATLTMLASPALSSSQNHKRNTSTSPNGHQKNCVQQPKNHHVPLQTREHAWAGIDGMPWLRQGSRGISRPEPLNLEAWISSLRDSTYDFDKREWRESVCVCMCVAVSKWVATASRRSSSRGTSCVIEISLYGMAVRRSAAAYCSFISARDDTLGSAVRLVMVRHPRWRQTHGLAQTVFLGVTKDRGALNVPHR